LKTPFSTNSHNKKWASSLDDIISKIVIQYNDLQNSIPYTMLQATMRNKKEYKVVLFNRVPKYIAHNPYSIGTSFSKYPHIKIMSFAANALNEFSLSCPFAMVDSIMRVDIFQTKSGKLVVNELESLEADHHPTTGNHKKDAVDYQVKEYYERILSDLLDKKFIKCKYRNLHVI